MPPPISQRRTNAVRCFAVKHPDGRLVMCRVSPGAKYKVTFESREFAARAAKALGLVDPHGPRVQPTVCRVQHEGVRHFHLRSVWKVQAAKRRRRAARRQGDVEVTERGQIMAEKTTEARTYECDAPKCDVVHVCVAEQEPKGTRLTAQAAYEKPVTVYACKPVHIRPAVEAVLEAQEQPADEEPKREEDPADGYDYGSGPKVEEDGQDLSGTAVPLAAVPATDEDDDPRTESERDADEQFAAAR